MKMKKLLASTAMLVGATAMSASVSAVTVLLNNVDPPGFGLNDPTPVEPVGGNPGTTVGEQRQNAFQFAADTWAATLEGDVPIVVQASFSPLECEATGGVLGAAGALQIFSLPEGVLPTVLGDTWYHAALFNSLIGEDATPGPFDPGFLLPPFNDDMVAFFNADLGTPGCLEASSWYYGFDGSEGPGQIDFLAVVTHEIAHGIGFSEFVGEADGTLFAGQKDIYSTFMLDTNQGKIFSEMTDEERLVAQVSGGALVWTGESVNTAAPSLLGSRAAIRILRPTALRGFLDVQEASFGPPITAPRGFTGRVVLADDGVGVGTDGCEPFPLRSLRSRIALIDRGGCAFVTKAINAQNAGARGVIIANNQPVGPAPVGGSSPLVQIPTVGITLEQGDLLRGASGVTLKLTRDTSSLAGANDDGQVLLFAPNPVQPGSSKSHFDTSASPNLLMEPSITSTLDAGSTLDLTPNLFEDIGWILK